MIINKNNKIFIVNVIIPLIIGGIIYVLFRNKNLIIFDWLNYLGLQEYVNYLRNYFIFPKKIPIWFKYSLPDFLWVYSLTSSMLLIWGKEIGKNKYFWFFLPLIIALISEFLQYFNLINGTFDFTDILFYLFSAFLSFLFLFKRLVL